MGGRLWAMCESVARREQSDGNKDRLGSSRWRRRAGMCALFLIAGALLFVSRRELPAAWSALRQARRPWLAIGAGASAAIMVAFSVARKQALAAFGIGVSTPSAIRLGFAAHALNTLGKSSGMAGAVVYRRYARQRGLAVAVVTAAYVFTAVLVNIAFGCVMLVALAIVAIASSSCDPE